MRKSWPQECQANAVELLPQSLHLLNSEIKYFLKTLDLNKKIEYTENVSRIIRRTGECEMFAEVSNNEFIRNLMMSIHTQFLNLFSEPFWLISE